MVLVLLRLDVVLQENFDLRSHLGTDVFQKEACNNSKATEGDRG